MKSFSARPLLLRFGACWLTILAVWLNRASTQAQDQSINGSLGVIGILDVNGNAFNFGSWSNDPTKFGLGMTYAEDATHTSTVTLTTTRSSSGWLWQQAASNNGPGSVPQMRLSAGNTLSLYDQAAPTPNARIVLDPVGTSSFGTSVTFNGANNLMPSQNLSGGAGSVLTVELADARYMVHSDGGNFTIGNSASASGGWSLAVGYSAQATASGATAVGHQTIASGGASSAYGVGSYATGWESTALGYTTHAAGACALALGAETNATGDCSTALGRMASAGGFGSSAFGFTSSANGDEATALSFY